MLPYMAYMDPMGYGHIKSILLALEYDPKISQVGSTWSLLGLSSLQDWNLFS